MIIFAIDPGTAAMGYALVAASGDRLEPIDFGCLRSAAGASTASRLQNIYSGINSLFAAHAPDEFAVEGVFFSMNAKAALSLGQAKGVALLAAAEAGAPAYEYSPRAVKQAVTGYGNASKDQVKRMVQAILKMPAKPPDHAADALAVAICHNHTRRLGALVSQGS